MRLHPPSLYRDVTESRIVLASSHHGRRKAAAVAFAAVTGLVASMAAVAPAPATAAPAASSAQVQRAADAFGTTAAPEAGTYTVVLKAPPSATYTGGVAGIGRTAPRGDAKFNAGSVAARRYEGLQRARQDDLLASVGNPRTLYRYTTALNGFSAELSSAQVAALQKDPAVLTVSAEKRVYADTVHTPAFLGMSGQKGVWKKYGGVKNAGKNIVVGVLDTGIWPENPSFKGADRVPDIKGFKGACQSGAQWPKRTCNSKVISARYYDSSVEGETLADTEHVSPRDGGGHGSHTASTAAGNHRVKVTIAGQSFGRASGMAPAAKIAVYKVLWHLEADPETGTGSTTDITAAIDRAVKDGVDVINYSIGSDGGGDPFDDATNVAFLNASAAGIFVAASAGNSGPDASTVGNLAPWITTTAASTSYLYQGAVELGNGDSYVGAMVSNKPVASTDLKYAGDIDNPDAPANEALCGPESLDETEAAGAIVVCDRGNYDRVAKSAEVKRAGGVGMVLTNDGPNSTDADFHTVPTVHLDDPATGTSPADAVRTYAQTGTATASLDPAGKDNTVVPQVAGFSSRGPAVPGGGDIIKPDIAAPGDSIVAAVAPPSNSGHRWDLYSGTSMASPHIAGLAAFIKRLRPGWSPMMIKSAMMTTAYNLKVDNSVASQGAGHVNPKRFLNPGLVFDSRLNDWLRFLAGQGVNTNSQPMDASNLNLPSIGIGDLVSKQTVTRRVKNVSGKDETYRITSTGLTGLDVSASPRSVKVPAGKTKKVRITFTVPDDFPEAEFGTFADGKVVFTGGKGHVVRIPASVKPEQLTADDEVAGETTDDEVTVTGKAGFTGDVDLTTSGLVGSTPVVQPLDEGPFDPNNPTADADTFHTTLTVPAGGAARFRTDGPDGDDLDLWVYLDDALVAYSATGSGDEQVTGFGLPAGTYDVYVNNFDSAGPTSNMTYDQWAVEDGDDAGNMTLDPDPLPLENGQPFEYTASWTGLADAQNWFGYVTYGDTGVNTIVTAD